MKPLRVLSLAAICAFGARSQADGLPAYQLNRADEDWGVLRDPALRELAWPYKFIPLGGDDGRYLSLGGEVRERVDAFDAPRFGIGAGPDTYLLQRFMLHADLHFGAHARIFAQLGYENAYSKAAAPGPSDVDRGDLQNLFIDVDMAPDLTIRFGRQELSIGAPQRFVSVRESPNVRQSFDGLQLLWHRGATQVNAFISRPVEYRPADFDDRGDHEQFFGGIHASRAISAHARLEGYYLNLQRTTATFQGVRGQELRHSLGARVAGAAEGWDYDAEGALQFGRFADQDIRAWAFGALVGYTLEKTWSPRLGLEFDVGSGDRDRNDDRLETFNPLFPKGAYFNDTALNSWANGVYLRPSLTVHPLPNLVLETDLLFRWRQRGEDAVYAQPYTAIVPTFGNDSREVGHAFELRANWKVSRSFTVSVEGLRQIADRAISAAGGRSGNYFSCIAQFRF